MAWSKCDKCGGMFEDYDYATHYKNCKNTKKDKIIFIGLILLLVGLSIAVGYFYADTTTAPTIQPEVIQRQPGQVIYEPVEPQPKNYTLLISGNGRGEWLSYPTGITSKIERASRAFNKSLADIIDRSMEGVEVTGDFDAIYDDYAPLFQSRYTTWYDSHKSGDYVMTVQELAASHFSGDCDDLATALMVLAVKTNNNARYMLGCNPNPGKCHAWIQVQQSDGSWMEYNSVSHKKCRSCISDRYNQTSMVLELGGGK